MRCSGYVSRGLAGIAVTLCAGTAPLAAQMPGMHHDAPQAVSAKGRREIDTVARAVGSVGTKTAAASAGFQPRFGWIPTMGEHWVSMRLMTSGRQTNRAEPSQLMFSKIGGKDSLVGAAYGYVTADNDKVRPSLFDGSPPWHEHPDLAPPGLTLVMLHVWFVPSPDGPFAGTNPNLPFWAAGLDAPDASRMHDAAFSSRARRASLALSEVVDTAAIFPNLEGRPAVRAVLVVRRDSVRGLIPQLLAAQKTENAAQ